VSPAATPTPLSAPQALRHRRSVRRLTPAQLADLRTAISDAQAIGDDRGYQYWAGIHGLPLPESCRHHTQLFLPWHRAYLYFFEKQLQDRVPGMTLPWWDWTVDHGVGIPAAYKNAPLSFSPIQPSGRRAASEKKTWRQAGEPSWLPTQAQVDTVLSNPTFSTFQTQLESIHNGVHGWVGGTMNYPEVAAYDPIFWAHHGMIDRLWYLWQLKNPGAMLDRDYLETALPPFPITVRQTLDITRLGYDYAAGTTAVPGTPGG
jgi:tyrosinase